jgi:hypothetical protein
MRTSSTRAGRRAGKLCHRCWPRICQTARERKKERFTALFHHINVAVLRDAFFAIRREAAPGVDGVTWQDYWANVETNLQDLHARVQRGAYRALPSRRQYIYPPCSQAAPSAGWRVMEPVRASAAWTAFGERGAGRDCQQPEGLQDVGDGRNYDTSASAMI